jgi:hypothetical protein
LPDRHALFSTSSGSSTGFGAAFMGSHPRTRM